MKKFVLPFICAVLYFGSCEAPNNSTGKTSVDKNATNKETGNDVAIKAQWEIDHPKILAFIEKYKMETQWLKSGVYYAIVNQGNGTKPTLNSAVNVSYAVSDLNGNPIWSTEQSNGAETRNLNKFPRGVSEGLQLIQEGGRIQLIVPSGLAYGAKGWGEQIPANTNLYYDIQLNSVQ